MKRISKQPRPWTPRPYQLRAKAFLRENGSAALFLDPGLGKTSVTLAAFSELLAEGTAKKMLVVAPLRVCQLVWRQEAEEWSDFCHLRFSLLHGPKKDEALRTDADVYLINPEGIAWLAKQHYGRPFPYDTLVIDELTKFKNSRSDRHKKLMPYARHMKRVWGLTGTPAPNGLLDLFGQILLLDGGRTFGRYITHYRDTYFTPGFTGFDYKPQPGADKRIQEKLEPIALRMKAEDYIDLPETIDQVIHVEMEPAARKLYTRMKNDMIAEMTDGSQVYAANAAGVTSKLKQMANGAVYLPEVPNKPRQVIHIHDAKLDALEDLVDELAGQPLLVAYEFNHDLERIQARFGKDIPFLGSGVTAKRAMEIEAAWNRNEIPVLPVHPASVGHGLNMQKGSARHLCWFSPTWDLELYLQLIGRIRRSGNQSETIMNYLLAVKGTVDELAIEAVKGKGLTQAQLLQGLQGLLHGHSAGLEADQQENEMSSIQKISRPGSAPAAAAAAEPEIKRVVPAGWGKPAAAPEPEPEQEAPPPRQNISAQPENRVDPAQEAPAEEAPVKSLFSRTVTDRVVGEADAPAEEKAEVPAETAQPARATRTKKAETKSIADSVTETVTRADEPAVAGTIYPHQSGFIRIEASGNAAEVRAALKQLLGL